MAAPIPLAIAGHPSVSPMPRRHVLGHYAHWTGQAAIVWGGSSNGDERSGGQLQPHNQ
ncbi:MAG: hypothetical protein IPL78_34720 [Chloroflexi bacterium]|nr:hypothetical protein [Chloroflexota bacterium]